MKNPLDSFESHSIHYIMLAARGTEDVRIVSIDSPTAQSSALSAIDSVRHLGDEIKFSDSTSAYLLMDTRRFSQFTITDFELETLIAGFKVPGSRSPNSTAVNLKFTVEDPSGIAFANFLQYIMDQKLQVSYDGMIVIVRVLFIGHHRDGTSSVVQSVSIPAVFSQITMDLNDAKGVYHCDLYPTIGMATNSKVNSKWTSIGTASTFYSGVASNTLGAVVDAFEKNLNNESLKRYIQLNAQTQNQGVKTTIGRYGRPVQYMITLPKKWEDFVFSGPTQGGAIETQFKELLKNKSKNQTDGNAQKKSVTNTPVAAKDSYVAVDPDLTITEVLDVIFSQCVEVAKLGNFTRKQNSDGSIRFYKHLVTVTSDDDSFTVHIDVVEFVVPNVDLATGRGANAISESEQDFYTQQELPDGTTKRVPKQYLEYDYLFSGKNIDILSMDLKIENLNYLLMQGSKLGQGELWTKTNEGQDQQNGNSISSDEHPVYGRRRKDPALMPARSHGDRTNYSSLAGSARTTEGDATPQAVAQQYTQNLQAYYSAGPVDVKVELRGNPDLMVSVALQSIPEHVSAISIIGDGNVTSKTNPAVKSRYRANFETNLLKLNMASGTKSVGDPINSNQLIGRNYVSSTMFVKINVYAPNVDFLTGATNPGSFSTKLFYDNYYFADSIISKISGDRFTQELSLRSFSLYNFPNTSAQGANTSTVKEVK
jgi:hypothetical protein